MLQAPAAGPEETEMEAARRYFSGDDDTGWPRAADQHHDLDQAAEGVSSKSIVSGLVAGRKQDHAVGMWS